MASIQCGNCSARLKLPSSATPGKRFKCPKCQHAVVIPEAPTDLGTPTAPVPGPNVNPEVAAASELAAPVSIVAPTVAAPDPLQDSTPGALAKEAASGVLGDKAAESSPENVEVRAARPASGKSVHGGDEFESELGTNPFAPEGATVAQPVVAQAAEAQLAQAVLAAPAAMAVPAVPVGSKFCPYCSNVIQLNAVKCMHCGEFLTGTGHNPSKVNARQVVLVGTLLCVILAAGGFIGYWFFFKDTGENESNAVVSGIGTSPSNPFPNLNQDGNQPKRNPSNSQKQPRRTGSSRPASVPKLNLDGQPPEIQRAMRANVRLGRGRLVGSGVVVQRTEKSNLILTNRHVVDQNFGNNQLFNTVTVPDLQQVPRPNVTYFDSTSEQGKVIWIAPDGIDLALVQTDKCPEKIEPVEFNPVRLQLGEDLFAVGNPLDLGWSFTKGNVSALREETAGDRQVSIIQTDTPIAGGSSGGGLYNQRGVLVGINTKMIRPSVASNIGFAIRTDMLLKLRPPALSIPSAGVASP